MIINYYPWYNYQENIKTVVIEEGITSISDGAFEMCESLTEVNIPNSVIEIGWDAFHECTSLTSVTIPSSVIYINEFGCGLGYYDYDGEKDSRKIEDFTIYGVAGTEAETYATANGFNFIAIEEENPPTTNKLTTTDILNLKKYILGISEDGTNLDFNSDGKVNILDLNTALNQLISK